MGDAGTAARASARWDDQCDEISGHAKAAAGPRLRPISANLTQTTFAVVTSTCETRLAWLEPSSFPEADFWPGIASE